MTSLITRRSVLRTSLAAAALVPALNTVLFAAEGNSVRIAVGVDPTFSHLHVASRKGFFDKNGVTSEIRSFDDGNVALDNLLTGNADIGGTSEVGTVVRRAKGGKICVVATGVQANDLYGIVGSDAIKTPLDLAGRTVGMPRGSGGHLYFGYLAEKIGLDLNKLTIRFVQAPEATAALARGDIDAFACWEPWLTRITATVPQSHIISRTGQDHAYSMNTYVLFTEELVANKPLAQKSLLAIIEASEWIHANREEAVTLVSEALRMKRMDAETVTSLQTWNISFNEKAFRENLGRAAEFAVAQGMIESPPSFEGFLRPDILAAVAPERVQ